ncbi:hypothetical protein M378DRAFT_128542 [Amanita muscaria Koide BX008]|uniref:DNA mismatch repair protein n=1 Tax=Amanita muscaria (strain Koide BX008) TaxID=946122 RepID=A0A0C2T7V5_AMAMK|nr:hypothetical protein M378DRAFT_128542 [Amanita muscaria Koide BX008]
MPPKNKQSSDSLKQKSLMTWFAKGPSKPTHSQSVRNSQRDLEWKEPSSDFPPTSSPESVKSTGMDCDEDLSVANLARKKRMSLVGASSREGSAPPTSDLINVDLLHIEDDEEQEGLGSGVIKAPKGKRKLVIESDEDLHNDKPSTKGRKSAYRESQSGTAQTKKQRIDISVESDSSSEEVKTSFLKRLTQFKKSPSKQVGKSRSALPSDDDNDFIPPPDQDDDDETKSVVSARSSRRSAASTSDTDDNFIVDDDEDEVPLKAKSKASTKTTKTTKKSKSTANSSGAGDSGAGSFLGAAFLTAAERREQGKKNEKKSSDEPFAFLQDVRDKDGRRPGDPKYDPRTLYIPPKFWKEFTPFEKQFWEIKQNHYDTILFFQKGKFFELYEDDARVGHQEFDLKLTSRVKMSMVGVPEYSFEFWAAKFLAKGHKVGRVEQAETALGAEMRLAATKSKGSKGKSKDDNEKIVRRELNKVYTNGTLVDPQLLADDEAGHCVAICEGEEELQDGGKQFGVCILDCSTSQFDLSALEDDICRTRLETLMRQVRPKEVLFQKGALSVTTTRLLKNLLPPGCLWTALRSVEGFDFHQTVQELRNCYSDPDGDQIMEEDDDGNALPSSVPKPIKQMLTSKLAIQALGNMIWYLRQLNIDKDIMSMKNFNIYDPMKRGQGLTLNGQTLAHLEVLLNNEGTESGTLLQLLNKCITPSGKRLFRLWLCMPLREIAAINARLDAVQDIINHPTFEVEFTQVAKGLPDLERIVSRIHAKNCKVKDFLRVLASFKKLSRGLSKLTNESESFASKTILGLLRGAPDLLPNIKNIENMFVSSGEIDMDELVPQRGRDADYDTIMTEINGLEQELQGDLSALKKDLGLNLSYWHSSIGNKDIYLVETTGTQKNIPKNWTKSSGTKTKTRYIVPSLQKKVRALKEARENRTTTVKAFKFRLFEEFDTDRAVWLRAIRSLAELDCLFSLAKSSVAIGEPSCRPEFVDGNFALVDFEELRHPTLCLSTSLKTFIPNGVKLGGDVAKIALLTGPNMAGKSTVMRMTATGVIMAQLGMLVPAASARLCPVDAIMTRMGAYDNMFSHASTFKVELDECCKILREATPKSLVILDELGRGTSTFDGMAIAAAVLHQLATHTLPLAFFATHYSSLTDDYAYHPNIRNMYMDTMVDDEKRDIVFLYKLVEGVAKSSFGTHVAHLAGVPLAVIERAEAVSKNFAQQFQERFLARENDESCRLPLPLQADFAYLYRLATGQAKLPEENVAQVEVLRRMKRTIGSFLSTMKK